MKQKLSSEHSQIKNKLVKLLQKLPIVVLNIGENFCFFSTVIQVLNSIQTFRKLQIWSHSLKNFLLENFIFCAVTTENKSQKIFLDMIASKIEHCGTPKRTLSQEL